ncbi:aspartic proteinase PCS1 isoform X1 [Cajanus cajan]|uniref:aspartic proteinase PCS1 isoform X1 n=1 Tax=Cajanus cajan TaxID=3821 RepID=UPI00098DC9B3|nr:aspartic proteinase PCS1 isoform X1 [Cajanus cajan]
MASFLFLHLLSPLTMTLFTIFLQIQTSSSSSSSSSLSSSPPTQTVLMLPLKTQTLPHGLVSQFASPRKLLFRHNVTLTVSLTVGTPPQSVTMVLDTGSELSWLHCKKPNTNTNTKNTIFNPLLSSSYTPTPCTSPICTTRTRDFPIPVSCDPRKLCHVTVSYADMTSLEGNLAAETFAVSGSGQPGTTFGCMDSSGFTSNADEDSKTTGLMGMNRGSLSFVTQMGFPKFSYCISGKDTSGVLLFGDAKFSWLGPLKYTPLVKMNTPLPYYDRVAYTVRLLGIRVGSKNLNVAKSIFSPDHTGAGQTMVDSGSQFSFLLGSVYKALRSEFVEQTKGVLRVLEDPNYVFEGAMDLCFRVKGGGVAAVPAVTLVFEGAELVVSGERLLYRVAEGSDVSCLTFGNSDLLGTEAYVIGHHHQRNVWMEFDLVNSRVGFADTRCELATQTLGLAA